MSEHTSVATRLNPKMLRALERHATKPQTMRWVAKQLAEGFVPPPPRPEYMRNLSENVLFGTTKDISADLGAVAGQRNVSKAEMLRWYIAHLLGYKPAMEAERVVKPKPKPRKKRDVGPEVEAATDPVEPVGFAKGGYHADASDPAIEGHIRLLTQERKASLRKETINVEDKGAETSIDDALPSNVLRIDRANKALLRYAKKSGWHEDHMAFLEAATKRVNAPSAFDCLVLETH